MNIVKYRLNKNEKIIFIIGIITLSIFISILFYDFIFMAFVGLLFYPKGKKLLEEFLYKRKQRKLRKEFCDFLTAISSSLATGEHMGKSIKECREQMVDLYGKDSLIVKEIDLMILDMNEKGYTEVRALKTFSKRTNIEEIKQFVDVFVICRETGGNLIKAIRETTEIIISRIEIENEIARISAQKKFEGRIITLMPLVVILFLRLTSPEYIGIMYSTWIGRIIMTIAFLIIYMAYRMIEKITAIEI